ncbi:MAG: lipoprotein [Naasia sp.]|jgi:LysM repeat protein|uniref:LysM peptidoglycan-binding domain-containing protein n=1 Tax=Naasia sp. TaxID=2546198 RepID=UPI00262ACAB7|nr:LysM peptidoglycan-binding domain-containing protein [Naasia sp.]MCU1569293.1 lipoprotein [Naasia sp.]
MARTLERLLRAPGARGRHVAAAGRAPGRSFLGVLPVVLAGSLALTLGGAAAEVTTVKRPAKPVRVIKAAKNRISGAAAAAASVPTPATAGADGAGVHSAATGPAQSYAPREYTVAEGDTVSDIAGRYGLSTASVLTLNGLSWKSLIFPGQVLSLNTASTAVIPADSPLVRYTISEGDTISGVAGSYGVDTDAVLTANGLGRDSIIFPGQSIVLPVDSPAAALERSAAVPPVSSASVVGLSDAMRDNARSIIRIGRELGVSDRGLVIALAAAAQESALHNLDWGHLDSVGLFQQRPGMGWGTPEQILDPEHSVRAFFGGPENPNEDTSGLLDIEGWESMALSEAAQAVQLSAYPDAYAKWEISAEAWLGELG